MREFWLKESVLGKFLVMAIFALFATSAFRLFRIARRLYFGSNSTVLGEAIANGEVGPELISKFALSNEPPSVVPRSSKRFECDLDLASSRACYLYDLCKADVDSAKQSAWLIYLLAVTTVAFRAIPVFGWNYNSQNVPGWYSLIQTVDELSSAFGVESAVSAGLFFAASILERKLRVRDAKWNYYFAQLKWAQRSPIVYASHLDDSGAATLLPNRCRAFLNSGDTTALTFSVKLPTGAVGGYFSKPRT